MLRLRRTMGVTAALGFLLASAAQADTFIDNQYFCGGDNFVTCATVTASISGDVVTLEVTNSSPIAGSVFAEIGLANLGAGVTASDFSYAGAGSWQLGNPPSGLSGAGIMGTAAGADASAPAPKNGLKQGETVTFTFTLNGSYSLDNVQFALHDIGGTGENGCATSTKLVVQRSGDQWAPSNQSACGPPTTTVPEPVSMTLLATGLAGIGGAGALRRRKRQSIA